MPAHCRRCPSPTGDRRPKAVCAHRRRWACCCCATEIVFQPFELIVAERAQAARLKIDDIYQADKVHALVIKAVPTCPFGSLTVALQKLLVHYPH